MTDVVYAPDPAALTAATRTCTGTPFARPVRTALDAGEPELAVVHTLPSDEVCTMYDVTGRPPELPGADHVMDNKPLPDRIVRPTGVPGTPAGVTTAADDGALVPAAFWAVTRTRWVTPLVSDDKVWGDVAEVDTTIQVDPPSTEVSTV
jgi:hypothetical protein